MQGIFNLSGISSSNGFAPANVSNLAIKSGNQTLTLTWNDPDDSVIDGVTVSKWKGTKVIYKTNGYPTGPDDGIVVVNNEERNKYATNGFVVTELTNDTTYYFQLFPYSTDGAVNSDESNRIIGTPVAFKIYGIKRSLSTSSPAWERTDDAVGLIANAQVGTTPVVNDFDSLYPWSDIYTYSWNKDTGAEIRYDEEGFAYTDDYIFTKIPTFWYKRWQDSTNEYIQIATTELEGFTKCDEFSVGRYTISGSISTPTTKSGVVPIDKQSRSNFRTAARTLPNCCLIDWRYFILQILYLVEYANYNSQLKLGKGYCNSNSSTLYNGSCDSLGMKSGRPTGTDGDTGVIYRGIENIYSNIYQFVDGINYYSGVYICTDPTKYDEYKNSDGYVMLSYKSYSSDGYASNLGYDSNYPLFAFPTTASGSETTYMCDKYNKGTTWGAALVGGVRVLNQENGLFSWQLSGDGNTTPTNSFYGSRLLKYQ